MDDLETLLLGEPAELNREDVERLAGVSVDLGSAVWAAMGFAALPYGQRGFTQGDVRALKTAKELLDLGVINGDTLLVMARAMGQGLAKLAEAQLDVFRGMSAGMTVEEAVTSATGVANDVLPKLEELVLFVWRRQFAAAVQRSLATVTEHGMPMLAIGFVDLVNFTRSSRTWDSTQLEKTLETFERDLSLRVTAVGGRVVKTLGDGVLYTTDRASDAVLVALNTIDAHVASPDLPSVRAGIAVGPVLVRLGDVFGEPVNIASRLADEARPDTLLVDRNTVEALPDWESRQLHKRSVRGYRALTPYVVKRPE